MNDDLHTQDPPENPGIDRALAAVGRFAPGAGFADRVLNRTGVPLPRPVRAARRWAAGVVSGPRGWVLLGAASLATAAFWVMVISVTTASWDVISTGLGFVERQVLPELALMASETLVSARAVIDALVAAVGVPLGAVAAGYAIFTIVSLVAVWRLTREPAHMRDAWHAVR